MKRFFVLSLVLLVLFSVIGYSRQRIVAGTVAIAEILDYLEVDEVVGVPTSQYDIPERYKKATGIGSPMRPNIEVIRSLRPTLFITSSALKDSLKPALDQNKIPSLFVELKSIDQLRETILSLGKLLGKRERAQVVYSEFLNREKKIVGRVSNLSKPSVLILSGSPGNFLVATEVSFVGSLCKKLGAKNVIKDTSNTHIPLNMEYILSTQPDYILIYTQSRSNDFKEFWTKEFSTNKLWNHFKAVKENRVIELPPSYFGTSANMKSLDALEMLSDMLFPQIKGEAK